MNVREQCIEKLEKIEKEFEELQKMMLEADIPLVSRLKMPMSSVRLLIQLLRDGDLPGVIPKRARPAAPKTNILK